jgi:hypothetical protein
MDRALRVILQRMPPNLNDFKNARAEDREKIMLKQPIIGAGIIEPVQVEVDNINDIKE